MQSRNRDGQSRAADWSEWRFAETAKTWEAVALSMNIDPQRVRHNGDRWAAGPDAIFTDEGGDFDKRLRMAVRALRSGQLVLASIAMGDPMGSEVYLRPFAGWAVRVGWNELPSEFIELAAQADEEKAASETGVATATGSTSGGPMTDASEVLGNRERDTLLRMLGALTLALARTGPKFQNGDKPNFAQIAATAILAVEALPDARKPGLSDSNLRDKLAEGVAALKRP